MVRCRRLIVIWGSWCEVGQKDRNCDAVVIGRYFENHNSVFFFFLREVRELVIKL